MKRLLGTALLVATLFAVVACGVGSEDAADRATDPAPTSPSEGSPAPDPVVVEILSGSAVGGDVATEATLVPDDRALQRYLRQFDSAPFVADLTAAVDEHPVGSGRVLGLAVIEISCDQPPSASVTEEGGAFVVTPGKVIDPLPECFAPVTSVAVLDLPV